MSNSNELTKKLMCVLMRGGVQIWLEDDKINKLKDVLDNLSSTKFIRVDDVVFNTADLVGIFDATMMEDVSYRKNGWWQCRNRNWHDKNENCHCSSKQENTEQKEIYEAIKKCGKCENGFIKSSETSTMRCECIKKFFSKN